MIILMNCLTDTADEGGVKLANHLARVIKAARPDTTLVSYGKEARGCDVHIPVDNKLMMNGPLARFLRRHREEVMYFPAYTRMLNTAVHTFVLSLAAHRVKTVVVMRGRLNPLTKLLFWLSRAEVIALSEETRNSFRLVIGHRAKHLKTGVDTERFHPVSSDEKAALRQKYGLPQGKPVVLHVGHMKASRNIGVMQHLAEDFHGLLVTSTMTAAEADAALRERLLQQDNLTIIDTYQPRVEELYQLADVYLFPVTKARNCIDVPLSVLEAAACGIPVVGTDYGEMKALLNQPGFYHLKDSEPQTLNALLRRAAEKGVSPRASVLAYDWQTAPSQLGAE